MIKQVEVYFTSENDAEAAHAHLKTLKTVQNISIEEMVESDGVSLFTPFVPINMGAQSGINNSFGSYGSVIPFFSGEQDDDNKDRNKDGRITHLLRCTVEDEDYRQAMTILGKHNSFVQN